MKDLQDFFTLISTLRSLSPNILTINVESMVCLIKCSPKRFDTYVTRVQY